MRASDPDRKRTTPEKAVARIRSGARVFVGTAAGEPRALVRALAARGPSVADVEVIQFHPMGDPAWLDPSLRDRIRANTMFVSAPARDAVAAGFADYTPVFLSRVPDLFRSRRIPLDFALVSVSPPDSDGRMSLGVSVDITRSALEAAPFVIAQVNPRMPRTFGGSVLHLSDVDLLVEADEPLPEADRTEPEDVHRRIAGRLAHLIPDGATLQVGAGRFLAAVVSLIEGPADLGIHTELFSDGVLDLVSRGAVTGAKKTFLPGRIVASLAIGSERLYAFLDDNPDVELHPSDFVNDIRVIAQNEQLVALNSGLQVDLTGQVCADSLGTRFYSGLGGHADFIRGAALSPGGRPIIALPSTASTPDGVVSRIVPFLSEGAGVLSTRGDVHWVVTEHGAAWLHGKSIRERALALIDVAHPDFRPDLLAAAKARRVVPVDQIVPPRGREVPAGLETEVDLPDGVRVVLRPVRPADEEAMKDLFYSFSEQTRYLRFHAAVSEMPHARRQRFCNVDYDREMALVVVREKEGAEEILAVGRSMREDDEESAEVAFVVRDDWQGRGLGRLLFDRLAAIAREHGLVRLTAEVLGGNPAMLHVFRGAGLPMTTEREDDEIHVEIDLTTEAEN